MSLANAYTRVKVDRTVQEIQQMLASHGAQQMTLNYEQMVPIGLEFSIMVNGEARWFRLPVRIDQVRRVLQRYHSAPSMTSREHAAEVGWRNIRDLLRGTLATIEAEQMPIAEMFFGFEITASERTIYELRNERGLPSLAPLPGLALPPPRSVS